MIIANISPSNCCALETLSTLKFAQRAKFIRNNAIVNEEASGDILTLRLQIQQLKKEVNRLRGLINGGHDKLESDSISASIEGSPTILKMNGDQTSFSPLTFDKRLSPRKEYEASLVAALKRIHDKEEELKALAADREAADQLVIHKTEEVRNLKLRLRFREDAIRRLEAIASAKLSPETNISQEREELLKELEVLRSQVDYKSEVTRFARENMQLREELKRLKSFIEDGERENMNEQITVLQDKLLEALDWKLMHEKNSEDHRLFSWDSSVNEENEFLHLEAIQNQREAEALRKNLTVCLEAKEKLERRVDELISQLHEEQKNADNLRQEIQHPRTLEVVSDDQMELKTMVDAIAAASQREAEAHERAIRLARENEELHIKLKVLIEDKRKLIDLYDNNLVKYCHNLEEDKKIENLEHQLSEMLEENEKLMGLYEKAMQERDDFKRMLASCEIDRIEIRDEVNFPEELVEENEFVKIRDEVNCPEEFVEEDEVARIEITDEVNCPEELVEKDELARIEIRDEVNCPEEFIDEDEVRVPLEQNVCEISGKYDELPEEILSAVQVKLDQVEKVVKFSCLIQKAANEAIYSNRFEELERIVALKQLQIKAQRLPLSDLEERKTVVFNKFLALKNALRSFSSKIKYWEERDVCAKVKYQSYLATLEQKNEELRHFLTLKNEHDTSCMKAKHSETELRNSMDHLKKKVQVAEAQRKENHNILLSIENLNISESRTMNFGKATDLLKSEEERTKIGIEMKKLREKLVSVQNEIAKLCSKTESLKCNIEKIETEIEKESALFQESKLTCQRIAGEKQMIYEMIEGGMKDLGKIFVEYQECIFQTDLKQGEILLCADELKLEIKEMEELKSIQKVAVESLHNLIEDNNWCSSTMIESDNSSKISSENAENQFDFALKSISEVKLLLSKDR